MIERRGIPVAPGVVIGEALLVDREDFSIQERFVPPARMPEEIQRFERALEIAGEELEKLQSKATHELGSGSAAIFQAHVWILRDDDFLKEVYDRIEFNHFTAEYAVDRAMRKYIRRLQESGVKFFQERIGDLEDIERRLINALHGERSDKSPMLTKPMVVIAHSLTPAQTMSFERDRILAFATDKGGRTSHTAILARDMGIPAVVGLGDITSEISPGDKIIVDGTRGVVIVGPDEATLGEYEAQRRSYVAFSEQVGEEVDLPAITLDGVSVEVNGNIEFPLEISETLERGGNGIGLYRTEFLYLEAGRMPDEEEHVQAYKKAVELLGGRSLVIRTLDLGADKLFPGSVDVGIERNPFLGCRSIRLCMLHPEIFRPQIRAILRVSTLGPVRLLLPMITTVDEVRWARDMIAEVKDEMVRRGEPFNTDLPVGAMIEVPSAALTAGEIAEEVDFFSIGTNDLIQYTLAVDRTNERVAPLYMPTHPSVLRLLSHVLTVADARDLPVTVCGEMAGEPIFTVLLLGMGLREFSMAAGMIPEVKKIIRSISFEATREIWREVEKMSDPVAITNFLTRRTNETLPGAVPQL